MSSYLYTAIGALGLGAAVVLGVVSMAEKSVAEPDAALLSSKERIASLERRIAELEAELAARAEPSVSPAALRGRAATVSGDVGDELAVASSDEESPALDDGDPHRLPTIEELFALVDRRDAEGLSAAVRKLLEAGDPDGFEVLAAFLGAEARSPRQALFGAGPLVASLFRVAFENDTATAAFADWVLVRADDSEPALLAKLRRVLPAFLSGRDGRFGDLHGRFVAHLDAIFATEDDTRWEALAAYTELRVPAPPEIISTLVSSPGDQNRYREILAHIAAVGHEAGIDALIAYLDGVESLDHWAVPLALRALAQSDSREASEYLAAWAASKVSDLSDRAELAYDSRSLESVVEVLQSGVDLERKRALVRDLAMTSPLLLDELRLDGEVFSDDVRRILANGGQEPNVAPFVLSFDPEVEKRLGIKLVAGSGFSPSQEWVVNSRAYSGGTVVQHLTGEMFVDATPLLSGVVATENTSQFTEVLTEVTGLDGAVPAEDGTAPAEPTTLAPPAPAIPGNDVHANAAPDSCTGCHYW